MQLKPGIQPQNAPTLNDLLDCIDAADAAGVFRRHLDYCRAARDIIRSHQNGGLGSILDEFEWSFQIVSTQAGGLRGCSF